MEMHVDVDPHGLLQCTVAPHLPLLIYPADLKSAGSISVVDVDTLWYTADEVRFPDLMLAVSHRVP